MDYWLSRTVAFQHRSVVEKTHREPNFFPKKWSYRWLPGDAFLHDLVRQNSEK